MLELVFVIIVIGILAAILIPRMDRDTLYEAAEQLVRDIRYTQHMAMTDNVYDDQDQFWFNHRWKIDFTVPNVYVVSKSTNNSIDTRSVIAVNPGDNAPMDGTVNDNYDLMWKYNIQIVLGGANNILAFDHMGRPYVSVAGAGVVVNPTQTLLDTPYIINLVDAANNALTAIVTVAPETGHATITYP